jgi:nicotinamide-nucleotide amidase
MKEMWSTSVEPALRAHLGGELQVIAHRVIRCFGVGESDLEAMLPDLIARERYPLVGITVSQATISLRITAAAPTRAEALALMEPTVATILACVGNVIFGEGEEELQHAIIRLLQVSGKTLATCEAGTGGLIAHWLSESDVDGTTYLGGEVLRRGNSNTADNIERLAQNCRDRWKADCALAIGPFPPQSEPGEAPGEVQFALATSLGVLCRSALFAGHPDLLLELSAKRALNYLRLHLLGES